MVSCGKVNTKFCYKSLYKSTQKGVGTYAQSAHKIKAKNFLKVKT